MKNIILVGGGVLGSQIAYQSAYCGFNVTIYLRSEKSVERTKEKIENLKKTYIETINKMDTKEGKDFSVWARGIAGKDEFKKEECLKKVEKIKINFETEIKKAFSDADLIIEAMPEDINVKKEFYTSIKDILPEKTIIVTNSSTLLPSKMRKYTGREENFLALHFANSIWKNNTAEVMCHDKTDDASFKKVIKFAEDINMIALPLKKEKAGYLLNSMLIPLLFSGLDLYVNGVSDVESIDKAWTLGTGAPKGPFRILDVIGLKTAYNIVLMYVKVPSFLAPYNFKKMEKVLKEYIDQNKLGVETKEGFYKY